MVVDISINIIDLILLSICMYCLYSGYRLINKSHQLSIKIFNKTKEKKETFIYLQKEIENINKEKNELKKQTEFNLKLKEENNIAIESLAKHFELVIKVQETFETEIQQELLKEDFKEDNNLIDIALQNGLGLKKAKSVFNRLFDMRIEDFRKNIKF